MAVIKSTHEIKVKVSPKRMFKAMVSDSQNILPKIAPAAIKGIDILEGDGGVGSIRQICLPDGSPFPSFKDKVATLDTENLVSKFIVLEGAPLGDKLESMHSEHKYEDSGDGGCIVKFNTEYHTKGDAHFTEEDIKEGHSHGIRIFTLAEQYLIAHPDVCA